MKATIKRLDGTVIEAEGSAEEIARLADGPAFDFTRIPMVPAPLYPLNPSPFLNPPWTITWGATS